MKVKRKRFCCAVLAYLMLTGNLMGNIAYGALLPGGSAGERDQMNLETILNDGLVMHSSFDESSISGNKVKDQTGRGNNGTIYGQPDFVKGILGNGVSMDNGSRAGQANTKPVYQLWPDH